MQVNVYIIDPVAAGRSHRYCLVYFRPLLQFEQQQLPCTYLAGKHETTLKAAMMTDVWHCVVQGGWFELQWQHRHWQ